MNGECLENIREEDNEDEVRSENDSQFLLYKLHEKTYTHTSNRDFMKLASRY